MAAAGSGSSTSALASGGRSDPLSVTYANTEFYDGTTWTELADLSVAKSQFQNNLATPSSASLVAGGYNAAFSVLATTEEWTAPDVVINTLTTS